MRECPRGRDRHAPRAPQTRARRCLPKQMPGHVHTPRPWRTAILEKRLAPRGNPVRLSSHAELRARIRHRWSGSIRRPLERRNSVPGSSQTIAYTDAPAAHTPTCSSASNIHPRAEHERPCGDWLCGRCGACPPRAPTARGRLWRHLSFELAKELRSRLHA